MANWKKVIVSGSDASLNSIQTQNGASITGSLSALNSVNFPGLTSTAQANIVGFDIATGQLYYQGTGSFTANSASFATSASIAVNADTASSVGILNQPVVISGSLSVNTTIGNSFDINADTLVFTGSFNQTGSVFLAGLTQVSKSFVVGYDDTTGQLTYQTAVDNADTASFAVSASYALTASYAETASYFSGSFTGSMDGTASYAESSSFALTASLAVTASSLYTSAGPITINAGQGTSVVIITGSLDIQSGASGSFSGSFQGDGSGLTGVVAASAFSLTGSVGISTFSYNGASSAQVEISGAAALTSGSVTKWSGNAFVNSSISDLDNVTINNAGGVLIQQGGLYVTGSSTFHDNVVVQGNLTVAGTASFQSSQNLAIADQFILLNSGSATFQDSGFVINTGNSGNSGSAWFLETAGTTTGSPQNGRFAVAGGVQPDATTVTADEYATTTKIVAIDPTTEVPQFGGSGLGQGNMWVNTENGEIFIYA